MSRDVCHIISIVIYQMVSIIRYVQCCWWCVNKPHLFHFLYLIIKLISEVYLYACLSACLPVCLSVRERERERERDCHSFLKCISYYNIQVSVGKLRKRDAFLCPIRVATLQFMFTSCVFCSWLLLNKLHLQ